MNYIVSKKENGILRPQLPVVLVFKLERCLESDGTRVDGIASYCDRDVVHGPYINTTDPTCGLNLRPGHILCTSIVTHMDHHPFTHTQVHPGPIIFLSFSLVTSNNLDCTNQYMFIFSQDAHRSCTDPCMKNDVG